MDERSRNIINTHIWRRADHITYVLLILLHRYYYYLIVIAIITYFLWTKRVAILPRPASAASTLPGVDTALKCFRYARKENIKENVKKTYILVSKVHRSYFIYLIHIWLFDPHVLYDRQVRFMPFFYHMIYAQYRNRH